MTRPISFHPTSVVFETPSHAELLEKVGVRPLITGVIEELLAIAKAQGCQFKPGFREQTMEQMIIPTEMNTTMYQDFLARRPMEIETYLGSPIKLAQEAGVPVPRIETLYAMLHNLNVVNQSRPVQSAAPPSPVSTQQPPPMPRMPSAPGGPNGAMYNGPRSGPGPVGRGPPPMSNGMRSGPGPRAPSGAGGPPPMRRGPPSMNGYPPPRGMTNGNGYGPRGPPQQMSRRGSFEGNDLEEFSHVMLYDDVEGGADGGYDMANASTGDLALRERELALRQKELALREREYHMRRGPPRRQTAPPAAFDDDDEDGEDYFDPMGGTPMPPGDADNLDMMSVTSRRTRKAPSASQLRANPELGGVNGGAPRNGRGAPWKRAPPKNRTSAMLMNDMPGLRQELMNNPMMGYSSDRYGNVDRHNLGQESRTNSLTAERLSELQQGPDGPGPNGFAAGPYPSGQPVPRRGSQSPGNPFTPGQRSNLRPSPPNGHSNGRPSPPGMRQPVPRHPPGHGNAVAPQQIEQQSGVSNLYPPKASSGPQVRSLTGSASASAGSGESNRSAPLDSSEPSAHSSSSSLGPRAPIGVR